MLQMTWELDLRFSLRTNDTLGYIGTALMDFYRNLYQ
jgi:hypothetical protein